MRHLAVSLLLAAAVPLASCDETEGLCATSQCQSLTYVTAQLRFVSSDPTQPGIIDGFDLDDNVSTGLDAASCYKVDSVASDGTPGIDNAGGDLFTLVNGIVKDGLDGLLYNSVRNGRLLLLLRVEGVDDFENDDHVAVRLFSGTGVPQLGTDGLIAPNQTFEYDPNVPSTVGEARIVNGVLEGGPFDAVIPFGVSEVTEQLTLHRARVRGDISQEENQVDLQVLVGGSVEVTSLHRVAETAAALDGNASRIAAILPYVVDPNADFEPDADGFCTQLSVAIRIVARPAFFVGDEIRETP